ncbi:hypothetical protein Leryth_001969 [Lithospermum erythrorhizon]|nr:hypothetical protein Leryth_001969 [Lithospermum erythrorhizon]
MDETEPPPPPQTPSLFPLPSQPSLSPQPPNPNNEWLNNPSFSIDLSIINQTLPTPPEQPQPESESESEEEKTTSARPRYELVESSASDHDSNSQGNRTTKKKKKKRKRKEVLSQRNSTVHAKEYYFDSNADRDNLAFGSLYRMDVARYKLYNSRKTYGPYHFLSNQYISSLRGDNDVDALDNNLRSGGRYWSPKYTIMEHHKNFKRIRIPAPEKPLRTLVTDFIPLSDESSSSESLSWSAVVEESWEDEVLRKTREFNKLTRESPHDEKVWLAFAEFQDKVSNMQTHKGARVQTLEKKISILEKATELNPDSEQLLLSLMNAYRSRDSTDLLISRWEKILVQNSGSYKLWREFLLVLQGEFSRFKVSEMRKMYANAIRALFGSCNKQFRQAEKSATAAVRDPSIVQLELCLVDTFASLCRFEWQAGYQELATSLFQAEIEYSLFCPSLLLTEQSKHRLFEYFWNSNGARVGEEGALGWATWLEKEEEQRKTIIKEELSSKADEGGWTGWSEPLSKTQEFKEADEEPTLGDVDENTSDGPETDDVAQEDDADALLKMLGIDAAAEANGEVKDPTAWNRWSKEELARGADQWLPLRAASDDAENDEHLLRVILFEDVSDYLFSINSEEARQSLVSQFIDFFGGRLPQCDFMYNITWAGLMLYVKQNTPGPIKARFWDINKQL